MRLEGLVRAQVFLHDDFDVFGFEQKSTFGWFPHTTHFYSHGTTSKVKSPSQDNQKFVNDNSGLIMRGTFAQN